MFIIDIFIVALMCVLCSVLPRILYLLCVNVNLQGAYMTMLLYVYVKLPSHDELFTGSCVCICGWSVNTLIQRRAQRLGMFLWITRVI